MNQDIQNFRNSLTLQQKVAMVGSMSIITGTPTGITDKESNNIIETAQILGISLDNPEFRRQSQIGRAGLAEILSTLDSGSRHWFVMVIYGLLSQHGKPEMQKLQIALAILGDIGISEDEFIKMVQFNTDLSKQMTRPS